MDGAGLIDRVNAAAVQRLPRQYGRVLVTLQFLWLGLLLVIPAGSLPFHSAGWLTLASACSLFAVAVAIAAFLSLGSAFRVRPEPLAGAQLVSRGVYRWIRHPMYTAVLAIAAAMALSVNSWAALIIWGALLVTLECKSHYEDALWRAKDGRAADYQRRVGRFLPRMRRVSW